ncbi:MAG: hypothetical protein WCV69_01755 [Patescibacteria group bacterium]|jgi:hypothetical protein
MNLFKKPKYLLMILLASFTFVTFVPQFAEAQADATNVAGNLVQGFINNKITADTGDWLAKQLGTIVYLFTIKLPSVILLLEIKMFNTVGTYNNFTGQDQVKQAWVTVRDLANMFFILILLLMAFGTILQVQGFGYRQLLSKLLLMAILINFSKSIVALLIDFSQVITLTFLAPVLENLAGNYVVALGLQKIMNLPSGVTGTYTGVSYLMAMILGGIMMIITTVIMGVILIMFVMRIISFWILIILAPMAFLARAFPKTSSYYGQWETELSKNLTTGPALAFFMWLAFSIVGQGSIASSFPENTTAPDGTKYVNETKTYDTVVSEVADTANMLNFVIAITLLMAGLKFAASSGAAGASVAGKASNSLQKWGSRIGRGATIGAAGFAVGGATRLAWQGTSGEGGAKGFVGQAGGFTGKGLAVMGGALGIGAMQRTGLALQAKESSRRQRKQTKYDKRFEGMSDEQIKEYNETVAKGVGFMGKREAKANLAKLDLEGKKAIDPKRAEDMAKDFEAAGDYKSLERLRARSMAVATPESFEKQITANGVAATLSKMNPQGMSLAQTQRLLSEDFKAVTSGAESMTKEMRDYFMDELDKHVRSGKLVGTIDDDKSDFGKAMLLLGKFDAKDGTKSSINAEYAKANDVQRAKFAKNLATTTKAEDLIKIDEKSALFRDVAGHASPGKTAEMYNLSNTDTQRKEIVNNQIRMGRIQNIINIPSINKGDIQESDIIANFVSQIPDLVKVGVAKGMSAVDAKFAAQGQLAHNDLKYGHLAFADPNSGAVNDADLSKFAQTLRFDDLLKLDRSQLTRLVKMNPVVAGTPHSPIADKGLTTAQLKLLEEKQGIT